MSVNSDHEGDLKKYAPNADMSKVTAVIKYLGIALQKRDSSLVATSDPAELGRIREGFAKKKLGLTDDKSIDAAMKKVAEKMKGDVNKSRVCFYYLLAEETGTLAKLG